MPRGEWFRLDARRTVESALGLDIRELTRGGLPHDGPRRRQVTWISGRSFQSSVSVGLLRTDALILYTEAGEQRSERVKLDSTPCNYGGERLWWLCPTCGRRCALLYLLQSRFECRTCCGLTYTSSQASPWIRSMRKSNKHAGQIGLRLGARFVVKPKGMHWRTFERLVAEYRGASAAASLALNPVLGRWETRAERSRAVIEHRAPGMSDEHATPGMVGTGLELAKAMSDATFAEALAAAADLLDPPGPGR